MVGIPPPNIPPPPQVSESRRTRWVRAFRLLLGCVWAVSAFASPVSAAELVSNIDQTFDENHSTSSFQDYATQFVTGSNALGYKVTGLDIKVEFSTSSPYRIEIRSDTSSRPGTLVGTFTNPASLTSTADNSFKAPGSGIDLEPGTTYWLVYDQNPTGNESGISFYLTASHGETGSPGWSINSGTTSRNHKQSQWGNPVANRYLMFTLNGYQKSLGNPTANDILMAVGMQALSSALDNIGRRVDGSLPQDSLNFAGFQVPPVSGGTDQGDYERCRFGCDTRSDQTKYQSIDSDDLLQSSAFSLSLGANEGKTDLSALDWSVWGRADLAAFEGRPEPGAHYDGRAKSGWFGIDGRTEQWVAGAALSKSWSETDYRTDVSAGQQRMTTELTALYPYGRWALDERSAIHAIAGIGSGEVRNVRAGSVEKSDLSMRILSVGVERQLAPRSDGMELSVRGEASTVRLKTKAGDESIDGLTPESWRIRMGLEGSRRISRDDGTVMEPFFDLAVRRDGGDGLTGYGLEASGGARYTAARTQIEFRGRLLLAHSGRGVRESGLGVTVRYLPESDGRGLSLSIRPHWGISTDGADALWRDELPQPEDLSDANAFDARIGYGFDLPSTGGVLTPFAENMHDGSSRTLRVGARFDAPRDNLAMELSGERRRNASDVNSRDSIRLDFSLRF